MKLKELDCVILKDGRKGAVLNIREDLGGFLFDDEDQIPGIDFSEVDKVYDRETKQYIKFEYE